MAEFDFIKRPPATVEALWQAVVDLLPQLGRRVLKDKTIGTTETAIAHGLGYAPKMAIPTPQASAYVWRTKAPDSKWCYFAASSACTIDIEIVP